MPDKYRKYKDELNRRVYQSKSLPELKRIGKRKGFLNVDQYKKADKNKLVERLIKGKQLEDESKDVLLKFAQDKKGLKVNATMSKTIIIEKIRNPKLEDLNNDKLREKAKEGAVGLKSKMTDNQIIDRLNNPSKYFTIESLTKAAEIKKIVVPNDIKNNKQDLINFLVERNVITITPIKAKESNYGVSSRNIPESLIRVVKKKGRNARERLEDFKDYLKNLKRDYITPVRLKKLTKQLEKKEEERKRKNLYSNIRSQCFYKIYQPIRY